MKVQNKWIARLTLLSLMFLSGMAVSSVTASAPPKAGREKVASPGKAKISLEAARRTALKHNSGTVQSERLETRKGKPVYAFEIQNAKGNTNQVLIDAKTGKMIPSSKESSTTDAQEKMASTKKKTKH